MNPELQIDSSLSTISFNVQKLGFLQVSGTMSNMKGKIVFNKAALQESYIDVSIDTRTLDTRNTRRDAHLKGEDFFDVARFPQITFKSEAIMQKDDAYRVLGYLSIVDSVKSLVIGLEFVENSFRGQFELNRRDFGLGNKIPTFIIGDTVKITIDCRIKS